MLVLISLKTLKRRLLVNIMKYIILIFITNIDRVKPSHEYRLRLLHKIPIQNVTAQLSYWQAQRMVAGLKGCIAFRSIGLRTQCVAHDVHEKFGFGVLGHCVIDFCSTGLRTQITQCVAHHIHENFGFEVLRYHVISRKDDKLSIFPRQKIN